MRLLEPFPAGPFVHEDEQDVVLQTSDASKNRSGDKVFIAP